VSEITTGFLRWHWGTAYEFTTGPGGQVTAAPRHAGHQPLTAATPAGLLTLIRRHYQPPRAPAAPGT
jgi:hypothetical protein